jgi:hypothetical protein
VPPRPFDWETELLKLAVATERLADLVGDPAVAARLRQISEEVRQLAQHGSDASGACCVPA